MPRIPSADIERLKQTIALERLAEARGVELKRHGAELIGRCPFHDDKTPSLVITPAKNLWHCLGACQAGGTVIDWVIRWKACRSGTPSSSCKTTTRLVLLRSPRRRNVRQ